MGLSLFSRAGFEVSDFEEPRLREDRYHLAASERAAAKSQMCPPSKATSLIFWTSASCGSEPS